MTEKIVEELRELGEVMDRWGRGMEHTIPLTSDQAGDGCLRCSLYGFARTVGHIANRLEAQAKPPEPVPETPEAETARLAVKFWRWADIQVECERGLSVHTADEGCVNPRPAEPLTVDVVLEVLAENGQHDWRVGPMPPEHLPEEKFVAYRVPVGSGRQCAPIPLLALLRALDAAGVMKKEAKR